MSVDQYQLDRLQLHWRDQPFGHAAVPSMWPAAVLEAARLEVESIPPQRWHHFRNGLEVKDAVDFRQVPRWCHGILEMQARLEALAPTLSALTGIPGLQYSPLGGGVHSIPPGGLLGIHRDFNRDEAGLWRRVNVLVYLQPEWDDSWGGHLQLHGDPHAPPDVWVAPRANTTVVFVCGPDSWHGHPEPHIAPVPRLSLAAYYFTREPPGGVEQPSHSTVFA